LEEIELNALCLFDKCKPATLTSGDLKFFDKEAGIIIEAVLPCANRTAERERTERLEIQDELEQSQQDVEQKEVLDEGDSFGEELRRAIKTVEVMGCIIKNRAGSLERTKLEETFEEAMNVLLRLLASFFEIIKYEDQQKAIIDFVSDRLRKITEECEDGKREPSEEKLRDYARIIFWNLNFFVVCGTIHKVVHSLGSDQLTEIVKTVCDKINTPASFLVKHGILMYYDKNVQLNDLVQRINQRDFSEIAKRAIKVMVVNHCSSHKINYKDRDRIQSKLGIPTVKLLERGRRES
jgi:hypothetical protein